MAWPSRSAIRDKLVGSPARWLRSAITGDEDDDDEANGRYERAVAIGGPLIGVLSLRVAYRALGAFDASFDVSSLTLSDFNLQPPFELGYSLGPPIGVAPVAGRRVVTSVWLH